MDKEMQKKEAMKRLEILNLSDYVIDGFRHSRIFESVQIGILFEFDGKLLKRIREWEKKTGNLVYHVIHGFYEFGECLSLLYVSKYEDEWEDDREILHEGMTYAYVINLDNDLCSEYGSIGIQENIGGLVRIA